MLSQRPHSQPTLDPKVDFNVNSKRRSGRRVKPLRLERLVVRGSEVLSEQLLVFSLPFSLPFSRPSALRGLRRQSPLHQAAAIR